MFHSNDLMQLSGIVELIYLCLYIYLYLYLYLFYLYTFWWEGAFGIGKPKVSVISRFKLGENRRY